MYMSNFHTVPASQDSRSRLMSLKVKVKIYMLDNRFSANFYTLAAIRKVIRSRPMTVKVKVEIRLQNYKKRSNFNTVVAKTRK